MVKQKEAKQIDGDESSLSSFVFVSARLDLFLSKEFLDQDHSARCCYDTPHVVGHDVLECRSGLSLVDPVDHIDRVGAKGGEGSTKADAHHEFGAWRYGTGGWCLRNAPQSKGTQNVNAGRVPTRQRRQPFGIGSNPFCRPTTRLIPTKSTTKGTHTQRSSIPHCGCRQQPCHFLFFFTTTSVTRDVMGRSKPSPNGKKVYYLPTKVGKHHVGS